MNPTMSRPTRVLRLLLVSALAGLGLVGVGSVPADAADAACQRTISSGPLARGIPDAGSIGVGIDVPEDGLVVTDLDVAVEITHPDPSELAIFLISATEGEGVRSTVRLFNHEDGGPLGEALTAGEDGLLGTVFDDAAATPISWGTSPFTGRFKPSKPLAVASGASGGLYQLNVFDDVADNVGELERWELTFTYASCDFDADGVEDHVDECRGLTARTASGCPSASRAVSASYRAGKFRGAMSAPVTACKAGRPVSVFRVRPGADARVGTTRTRADGTWRLTRAKRAGRYYATSPRVVVPGVAECAAVTSARFRIR